MDEKENWFVTCTCRPHLHINKDHPCHHHLTCVSPHFHHTTCQLQAPNNPIISSTLDLPNELQIEMCVRFVEKNYFPFVLIYVTLRATNLCLKLRLGSVSKSLLSDSEGVLEVCYEPGAWPGYNLKHRAQGK